MRAASILWSAEEARRVYGDIIPTPRLRALSRTFTGAP
jgi:hypothetical protein